MRNVTFINFKLEAFEAFLHLEVLIFLKYTLNVLVCVFSVFFCNFLFSFVKWRFNGEGKGRHNWGETTGDHNRGKQTYNKNVKW